MHRLHQVHPGLSGGCDRRRIQTDAHRDPGSVHRLRAVHPAVSGGLHRDAPGARRGVLATVPRRMRNPLSRWYVRLGLWLIAIGIFGVWWPAWEMPHFIIEPENRWKAFLQLALFHGSWL